VYSNATTICSWWVVIIMRTYGCLELSLFAVYPGGWNWNFFALALFHREAQSTPCLHRRLIFMIHVSWATPQQTWVEHYREEISRSDFSRSGGRELELYSTWLWSDFSVNALHHNL
jgi:hypothetical protein